MVSPYSGAINEVKTVVTVRLGLPPFNKVKKIFCYCNITMNLNQEIGLNWKKIKICVISILFCMFYIIQSS